MKNSEQYLKIFDMLIIFQTISILNQFLNDILVIYTKGKRYDYITELLIFIVFYAAVELIKNKEMIYYYFGILMFSYLNIFFSFFTFYKKENGFKLEVFIVMTVLILIYEFKFKVIRKILERMSKADKLILIGYMLLLLCSGEIINILFWLKISTQMSVIIH